MSIPLSISQPANTRIINHASAQLTGKLGNTTQCACSIKGCPIIIPPLLVWVSKKREAQDKHYQSLDISKTLPQSWERSRFSLNVAQFNANSQKTLQNMKLFQTKNLYLGLFL